MIAAIVGKMDKGIYRYAMLLPDHTVVNSPDDELLRRFLESFKQIDKPVSEPRKGQDAARDEWKLRFRNGKDGTWTADDPEFNNPAAYEKFAYITDDHALVILNFRPFQRLMARESEMVSVDEIAYDHNCSREIVKRYCRNTADGTGGFRIQGARKLKRIDENGKLVDGRVWVVPKNAVLPWEMS